MKKTFIRLVNHIFRQKYFYGMLLFILGAFIVNTLHTQFPDEFDNIYGGFLINHGKLPYIGFFTHHNPGAYFLASIITLFTQRSFVLFRMVFAILLFAGFLASYFFLKKRLKSSSYFFLFYGVLLGIGSTYWWGQMLLSETVVGYLLAPIFILLIVKKINRIKFDLVDVFAASILTSLSIFTSLTYIYFIPAIDLLVIYYYWKDNKLDTPRKKAAPFVIFATPFIVFFGYLLLTGSLSEFYFQSIYYNINYYIFNFPKVADVYSHNPVRYGISIAAVAFDNFYALLTQINSFNTSYPLNISLVVANVAVIIFFMSKRHYSLVFLMIWMMFYTNARSGPLNSKESDFHITVYIMLTLVVLSWFFYQLKEELNKKILYFDKLVFSFLFIVTSYFWFLSILFFASKFINKAYAKLMGQEPLIYDRPQAAPTINKIASENDYFWIGPFELTELLFIRAKLASKYYWFLPANAKDEKIKREIIADLTANRPKVIVFKKWWSTFAVAASDFNTVIVDFLDKNYFTLDDLRIEGLDFKMKVNKERDFDFEKEFFFDKEKKDQIIDELFQKEIIGNK